MNLSQLVMLGIPGDGDLAAVRELQPGGVILMGRNAGTPREVRRLTRSIQENLELPALIATDQEGGRVQRLKDEFTLIPSMREAGRGGAQKVGLLAMNVAAELRGAGINTNFAPVCDVPTHPEDTVIGDRAFSDNPLRASLLAAEYIRGAQPTVMCSAKHFPGHGGVGVDSHHGLPTFSGTREDLEPHLGPFRGAIAAGVGSIMVGHIAVPALDESGTPATLSPAIVTGLLREELGFRGLVVTDDLEMGALKSYDPGEVAVRAIAAGCDLLLYCHSSQKAKAAIEGIRAALESGALTEERVNDALGRVEWAKRRFGVIS
jgi:beta-N-acetylhexosaminidase